MKPSRPHPLYFLVAALSIVFTVSACAYGVMSFKARGSEAYSNEKDAGLMRLMREHGGKVLGAEIAALALAAFAAMASDARRERHSATTRDDANSPAGDGAAEQ
jgi:hypothetical protein